tara:strand:- start:306 stop:1421 length:1116 start_codon:yes stop_codon:yes gene_type:complete
LKKIINILLIILLATSFIGGITSEIYAQKSKNEKNQNKKDKKKYKKAKKTPVILVDSVATQNVSDSDGGTPFGGSSVETIDNLSDKTLDLYDKYETLMNQNQFDKARETVKKIPKSLQSEKQQKELTILIIFDDINQEEAKEAARFGKDESMDPALKKTIKRLHREAKKNILKEQNDMARDILIQSIYLDRKNFVSKQLLDKCLDLPIGSYKVENIEAKYWKNSLISLRSGLPEESIKSLNVLKSFDQQNSEIFERLGSAYYIAGMVPEAVKAWETALFLEPENNDLKKFIENAKIQQEKDEAEVKAFLSKKKNKKANKYEGVEMQVLRVVNDLETATSYAQSVRENQPGVDVIVEEDDNGKYLVKIPKPK